MTSLARLLTAAAAAGTLAAPAAAQYPYPQPYPQQYPGYPQQYPGYPQQGYGGSVIDQVIGQLLGNRYNGTDRRAVSQCASAAMVQAQNQYRGYGQQGYGGSQQGYGGYPQAYGQGIAVPAMRVTAITSVERRQTGLRVRGLIDSGFGGYGGGYGQYGYQNQAYATGDLTFRCNVDYRGYVTNVRISRNNNRRY
jgi:hypothetical protein